MCLRGTNENRGRIVSHYVILVAVNCSSRIVSLPDNLRSIAEMNQIHGKITSFPPSNDVWNMNNAAVHVMSTHSDI